MKINIVLPETSDDPISELLIALTERICEVTGEETGFGLGGRFGYGENFENEVFRMHRFCWCDQADCEYCEGDAPHFLHKPSGATVRWYKYIGRGMKASQARWGDIFVECFESLSDER